MRQDVNHREVFARQDSLGEDFALIFDALADAFRGMSNRRIYTHWSCLRAKDC
jgi:hypothetical protein